MGQPAGVEGLCPPQGLLKGAAVGALVAHGPHHHTGPVLVPLDAFAHPVADGLHPLRPVGDGLVPAAGPDSVAVLPVVQRPGAVGLHVGLVDDQEAIGVAELVKLRGVGVVAGADGVDVVLLHQDQIPLHVRTGDRGAGDRVGVVAVDAPELDGRAVEIDPVVRDVDLPQTHPVGDGLPRRLQHQGVEVRVFRAPEDRVRHWQGQGTGVLLLRLPGPARKNRLPGGVQQGGPDGDGAAEEVQADVHQGGVPGDAGLNKVVEHAVPRAPEEVHVPENTAGAELVLVLQVAAVAPLEHQHRQPVAAVQQEGGDVELGCGVGHLAVAHIAAVEPDVKAGVDALKVQVGGRGGGVRFPGEIQQVCAAGVVLGDIGGIEGEGIADIGVLAAVAAVGLPHIGDCPVLKAGGIVSRLEKPVRQVVDAVEIPEPPLAAEHPEAAGGSAGLAGVQGSGGGDVVGAVGHGVFMEDAQVLIVSGHDHGGTLLF